MTEEYLMKYLKEKHKITFPYFRKVEFETMINGYFSNERIGRADMTFRYHQRWYVCEIKHEQGDYTTNFWTALKVLGYAEALSMIYKEKFYPIIMIPKKAITNDILAIIGKLNIDYISVYLDNKREIKFDIFT